MVWLNPDRARQHATAENFAVDSGVHHYIHRMLDDHNRAAGSCDRISAAGIQTELLAAVQTTDGAYAKQHAVSTNRAAVVHTAATLHRTSPGFADFTLER